MSAVQEAIRERAQDLDALAVDVRTVSAMPDGMWGAYDAQTHTIYLRDSLAPLQARSTLAHEIIHAKYRHAGRGVKEQEDIAEREAAAHLIGSPERLSKAARDLNLLGALAIALGVLPRDIRNYLDAVPGAGAELLAAIAEPNEHGLRVPRPTSVGRLGAHTERSL